MKLVTGIEAIQSGKPWRNIDGTTRWIQSDDGLGSITTADLLKKEFIIKEEPREFWIDTTYPNCIQMYPAGYAGADFDNDRWIKVREIEK